MIRVALPVAVLLVLTFAITGCSKGWSKPAAQQTSAVPVAVRAPMSDNPCGGVRFVIDTVHALQVGWLPVDRRGAMQRIAAFARSAPPEIRGAAEDVSGVSASAMKKPEAGAEISTGAVAGDLAVLDNWCSSHCRQSPK